MGIPYDIGPWTAQGEGTVSIPMRVPDAPQQQLPLSPMWCRLFGHRFDRPDYQNAAYACARCGAPASAPMLGQNQRSRQS